MPVKLVLASTSVYRQALLQKLNLPFSTVSPDIDETPLANEDAVDLVARLAEQKAKTGGQLISADSPDEKLLIIGSDQVAVIDEQIVGKPHTIENAIKQLTNASGKSITFYTGLSVYCPQTQKVSTCVEPFNVHFKNLTTEQIKAYVLAEQPLYCAGSFKSEGLGIALFEKLEGDDPNTLIGLPLIKLINLLGQHGLCVLSAQNDFLIKDETVTR
ncbi:Maf family protein [Shewanella gaetbuli]|uniref:7-methyl-GTP pyrophosphatase n=1 Tax=Shewanella gaetbuli TaxID=220752 RepID=A0A9X2CLV6_9GAMM|nr:nucleoside triphosphate pyrophosphatase [Shewanella gaetbuli]MCL1143015.1 Maf-like protein [Shewanella gaetbuli]